MEDSGIDSDPKTQLQNEENSSNNHLNEEFIANDQILNRKFSSGHSSLQLHRKLEKQVEDAKKIRNKNSAKCDNSSKKSLLPHNRLTKYNPVCADEKVLVTWDTDSEDDFDIRPPLSKEAAREIRQQLIKDGFNLDLSPDDDEDDLDFIPPPKPETLCGKRCCVIS
ncbi:FAM219A (predicted) [Pycnogonum litorale]